MVGSNPRTHVLSGPRPEPSTTTDTLTPEIRSRVWDSKKDRTNPEYV